MKKKIFAAICSVTMMAGATAFVPALDAFQASDAVVADAATNDFSYANTEAWYHFTYTNGVNANAGYKITSYQPYQWVTAVHFPDWVTDNNGHSGSLTAIGDSILNGNTRITSVSVPDTVLNIGNNFCDGATKLQTATVSNNLKNLGNYGFYGCSAMNMFQCDSQQIEHFGYGSLWANKWADSFNKNNTTALIIGNILFRYYKCPPSTLNDYAIYGRKQLDQPEQYYYVTAINDFAFGAAAFPTSYGNAIRYLNFANIKHVGTNAFIKLLNSSSVRIRFKHNGLDHTDLNNAGIPANVTILWC